MYEHQIKQAIRHLHEIEGISIEQAQELVLKYPYFQTAHLLLAKKAKNNESKDLKSILSKAATIIPNREILYRYLFFDRMPLSSDLPSLHSSLKKQAVGKEEIVKIAEVEEFSTVDSLVATPLKEENIVLASEETEEDLIDPKLAEEVTLIEVDEQDTSKIRLDTAIITAEAIAKVEREIEMERIQLEQEQQELLKGNAFAKKDLQQVDQVVQENVEADLQALKKELEDDDSTSDIEQSVEKDDDLLLLLQKKVTAYQQSKKSLENWEAGKLEELNGNGQLVSVDTDQPTVAALSEEDEREIKDYVSRFVNEDMDQLADAANPDASDTEPIILSETMAKVYARQGHADKAINIYRQLILKYPEKRPYFAVKIDELTK